MNDSIINHKVFSNATHGSVSTLSLFHNLRSSLWKDHKVDVKEFLEVAGPALANFNDTALILQNDFVNASKSKENDEKEDVDYNVSDSKDPSVENAEAGTSEANEEPSASRMNPWRQQAEEDPSSLAADFQKMCTSFYFDQFYFNAHQRELIRDLLPESELKEEIRQYRYEEGSSRVGSVALLDARVMIMHDEDHEVEHPEFQASEQSEANLPVAAQLDILHEVSCTIKTTNEPETIKEFRVASIEGWINGGPDKELRWKVADLQAPSAFGLRITT